MSEWHDNIHCMKIIVNPKYAVLQKWLTHIATHFEESNGKQLHKSRNCIKVFEVDGISINVKRYGIPSWPNRLIYSFLRAPKGLRAYRYPFRMLARGVETPESVAYIEERHGGIISTTYYVSIQCPYLRRFYEMGDAKAEDVKDIIRAFARFSAHTHEVGILHLDYSPGNILFDRNSEGEWCFSLVDTNRMRFGTVSVKKGCQNFARLWGQPEFFRMLAQAYAEERHADPSQCTKWVMDARRRFWKRFSRKHPVKYHLKFT